MSNTDNSVAKGFRSLFQRTAVAMFLKVARSLLVIPLLSPAELGVFRYFTAIFSYVIYFHGGALQTLSFRYAESDGRKDILTCQNLQTIAFSAVFIGGIAGAAFLLAVCNWQKIGPVWLRPWLAGMGALSLVAVYVQASYRVRRRFGDLARNGLISDTSGFIFALAGVYFFGLEGLLAAFVMAAPVSVWLGREWLINNDRSSVTRMDVADNLLYGLKLMISRVLSQMMITVDIILLRMVFPGMDPRLGYYALAATLTGLIATIVGTVAEVQSQNMLFQLGETRGGQSFSTFDILAHYTARESLIAIWASCAAALLMGIVVPSVLKDYLPSMTVLGGSLFAGVLLRFRTYAVLLLNIRQQTKWVILASALSVGGIAGHIAVVHYWFDDSLVGYSFSCVSGFSVSSAVNYLMAIRLLNCWRDGWRFALRYLTANTPVSLYALMWIVSPQHPVLASIGISMLVCSLALLTYRYCLPGTVTASLRIIVPDKYIKKLKLLVAI